MKPFMVSVSWPRFVACLWQLSACILWCLPANTDAALPVEFEAIATPSTLVISEPLTIDMHVTNTGSEPLERFSIGGSGFWLVWYQNYAVEGCELFISSGSLLPPFTRDVFGFHWDVSGLAPGETWSCRVTYPQTLFAGREAISLNGTTWIDDEFVSEQLTEITYSLLPPSGIPVLVETAVEHPIVMIGEPLAVDLRFTNLGEEVLGPLSVQSSEFTRIGREGYVLEDCAPGITAQLLPSSGQEFRVEWRIPGLQQGQAVSCRAIFPQTLHPGEELIHLSVLLDGVTWEEEAAFTYLLQPSAEPPFIFQASPRQATVMTEEPLDFELSITNTSQKALTNVVLIGEPFFVASFTLATAEGCEFFQDLRRDFYLFGWPIWGSVFPGQHDNLEEGERLVWRVPELAPGETARCHITLPSTSHTGEDTVRWTAWMGQTPWRSLAELSYAVLSELPPPEPVPVNSRVWLILAALMLLLIGGWRVRLLRTTVALQESPERVTTSAR